MFIQKYDTKKYKKINLFYWANYKIWTNITKTKTEITINKNC